MVTAVSSPPVFGTEVEVHFRGRFCGTVMYMAPRRWRVVMEGVTPYAFKGTEANVRNHVVEKAKEASAAKAAEWARAFMAGEVA